MCRAPNIITVTHNPLLHNTLSSLADKDSDDEEVLGGEGVALAKEGVVTKVEDEVK
jgi:hypothetical protein